LRPLIDATSYYNACTQFSVKAIAQSLNHSEANFAQEKTRQDKVHAEQDKTHEKKKARKDFSAILEDENNPWPGLSGMQDWIKCIKYGLEDLDEGKDAKGEVKKQWLGKVNNTIRQQLKM